MNLRQFFEDIEKELDKQGFRSIDDWNIFEVKRDLQFVGSPDVFKHITEIFKEGKIFGDLELIGINRVRGINVLYNSTWTDGKESITMSFKLEKNLGLNEASKGKLLIAGKDKYLIDEDFKYASVDISGIKLHYVRPRVNRFGDELSSHDEVLIGTIEWDFKSLQRDFSGDYYESFIQYVENYGDEHFIIKLQNKTDLEGLIFIDYSKGYEIDDETINDLNIYGV